MKKKFITINTIVLLQDTRTHAIGELYDTERSYVESLQILVTVSWYKKATGNYIDAMFSSLLFFVFLTEIFTTAKRTWVLRIGGKQSRGWNIFSGLH